MSQLSGLTTDSYRTDSVWKLLELCRSFDDDALDLSVTFIAAFPESPLS